jgi:hypothetical protein
MLLIILIVCKNFRETGACSLWTQMSTHSRRFCCASVTLTLVLSVSDHAIPPAIKTSSEVSHTSLRVNKET